MTPVASLVLSLALYAIASRQLTPAEFGRLAVAIAVLSTAVPFVSVGTPVILVRQFAGNATGQSAILLTAAYATILLATALILALAAAADWLVGDWLAPWLAAGVAPMVAVGAGALACVELRAAEEQAAFHFRRQFSVLTAAALVRLAGVGIALSAVSHPDHKLALAGFVGGSLLAVLTVGGSRLLAAFRHWHSSLGFIRDEIARTGLPLTASTLLAVSTSQVDTIVGAVFLDSSDLAQYAAAYRLSMIHVTAIGGLTAIALPVAAAAARTNSLRDFAWTGVAAGLMIGTIAVGVSVLFGPWATRVLFGAFYEPSAIIFGVLSVGLLLNYPGNPVSQVLYMTSRAHVMVVVQLIQLLVFAGGAALVSARWGATGLAITRAVVNLVSVAVVIGLSLAVARTSPPAVEVAPVE